MLTYICTHTHIYTHTSIRNILHSSVKYNFFLIPGKQKSFLVVLAGLDPSSSTDWVGAV